MWLKQSQVPHYLVSLGLVNPLAVLEEDLIVTDVSRRNCVFLVSSARAGTLVVKQADADTAAAVAHEAAVTRALARVPALAGTVPELVHFDPRAARLVLRSPAEGTAFGAPSVPLARRLGRVLAATHAFQPDFEAPHGDSDRLWALSFDEPPAAQVHTLSAGALELLARVQGSSELCERLRRVRSAGAEDAFVHGDLRWDNCLRYGRGRLLVIDWELAGRGEAASDLGTALGEHVRAWVDSIPKLEGSDILRFADHAGRPLARCQAAMRALWEAYRGACRRPVELVRVVELTAVRLLQAAFEYAQGFTRPTGDVVALLQVADNMLRWPGLAASSVLGLRE